MNNTSGSLAESPVARQVEAYQEAWQTDHEAVKECWEVEECIAVGIASADVLERAERLWRERVFRGTCPAAPERDLFFRSLVVAWLKVSNQVLQETTDLEKKYGRVEGAHELRAVAVKLRDKLTHWQPPRLATAVGLRDITLTPEAAQEMDRILGEAKVKPRHPNTPKPRPMTPEELQRVLGR
jgi:hypothetical protein